MVGGDAIAQLEQHAGTFNIFYVGSFFRNIVEERNLFYISRGIIPVINLIAWHLQVSPYFVAFKYFTITVFEVGRRQYFAQYFIDFVIAWPYIFQINRLFVVVVADWFVEQVDINTPGNGISYNQHWRHKEVHLHFGMHTSFKVSVARKNRSHHQVVLINSLANERRQRT